MFDTFNSIWNVESILFKNEKGQIMYQFSKCYEKVPKVSNKTSQYNSTIIWSHPAETHVIDGELTDEYWEWREKGMNNPVAIRYHVGFNYRSKCRSLIKLDDNTYSELNYIEGRKQVYINEYAVPLKKEEKFKNLKMRLEKGENLLIIEVDGPHQESLNYYKEKYNVDDTFIQNSTMLINEKISI